MSKPYQHRSKDQQRNERVRRLLKQQRKKDQEKQL